MEYNIGVLRALLHIVLLRPLSNSLGICPLLVDPGCGTALLNSDQELFRAKLRQLPQAVWRSNGEYGNRPV